MTVKNTKTNFAAFEAKELKIAQQLQVKGGTDGGDGGDGDGFIGEEDVVISKTPAP